MSLVTSFEACNNPFIRYTLNRIVRFTPRLYFFAKSLSATVDRIIAPVSVERTSAPDTFGFDETRARVASKSARFSDGGGEVAILPSCC